MSLSKIAQRVKQLISPAGGPGKRSKHSTSRPFRPLMEPLEDRLALSTLQAQLVPLAPGRYINSYANVGFQENVVGTLLAKINGQADTNKNDFHVQLQWGDGQTSDGHLVFQGAAGGYGQFLIKGSNTYHDPASNVAVKATVTASQSLEVVGGNNKKMTAANVSYLPSGVPGTPAPTTAHVDPEEVDMQIIALPPGRYVNTHVGDTTSYELGTLNVTVNGQPDPNQGDFHAYVNWGDNGSWHEAQLVPAKGSANGSSFTIKATPPYTQTKSGVPVVVYATGPDGTSTNQVATKANVAPAPLKTPATSTSQVPSPAPAAGNTSDTSGITYTTWDADRIPYQPPKLPEIAPVQQPTGPVQQGGPSNNGYIEMPTYQPSTPTTRKTTTPGTTYSPSQNGSPAIMPGIVNYTPVPSGSGYSPSQNGSPAIMPGISNGPSKQPSTKLQDLVVPGFLQYWTNLAGGQQLQDSMGFNLADSLSNLVQTLMNGSGAPSTNSPSTPTNAPAPSKPSQSAGFNWNQFMQGLSDIWTVW